jgi:hypothetical protein
MKTFREAVQLEKKYVSVTYDEPTQRALRAWAHERGFDLTKSYSGDDISWNDFKFHTTVFFTSSMHSVDDNMTYQMGIRESVNIIDFEYLGENKDIPVLRVDGEYIRSIRQRFEKLGIRRQLAGLEATHLTLLCAKAYRPDSTTTRRLPNFSTYL